MSDGPHRSLPMRQGWKDLAERADKCAYDVEEIKEALPAALAQDWAAEVGHEFVAGLHQVFTEGNQGALFDDQTLPRLEGMRRLASGHPLSMQLVEHAIQACAAGKTGAHALQQAAADTLHARATSSNRQIEEHYCREADAPRANNVRTRIESAIDRASIEALARDVAGMEGGQGSPRLRKRDGVDDGVTL